MTDEQLSHAIEALLVKRNPRNMQRAKASLQPGYYLRAARCLHEVTGTVIIGTGFPVDTTFETDGPVGAIALHDCLERDTLSLQLLRIKQHLKLLLIAAVDRDLGDAGHRQD